MSRRAVGSWLAGVLAAVAALGACGIDEESSPRLRDPEDVPFGLADPPVPTTVSATPTSLGVSGAACFVDGDVIIRRPVTEPTLLGRLRASPADGDTEIVTALPDPALVLEVTVEAGVAAIDLGETFVELPTATQRLAVAQLVCTASSSPGVGQVRFLLDDEPLAVPEGDGSSSDEPVSLDDYRDLLADEG